MSQRRRFRALARPLRLVALALTLGLIVAVAPPTVFGGIASAVSGALPGVVVVIGAVIALAGAWFIARRVAPSVLDAAGRWLEAAHRRRSSLPDIDAMDGPAFERFVAEVLERRGFQVAHTGGSGDLGVDLIARKGYTSWAVQVKRYDGPVNRRAVSDAVAGKEHYQCNDAMVVTNSVFTEGARTLARSTGCELVDRHTLARWVRELSM